MSKIYAKDTWTDEVLTEAALHEITDPAGDPVPGSVTDLTTAIAALNSLLDILATGSKISLLTDVAVAGTALTAARMNNIEDGVDALDTLLDSVNNNGVALQNKISLKNATELTIATGAITITQGAHKLQPESGTADVLSTIGGMAAGEVAFLFVSDKGTDTITVEHGTDNISCVGEADIVLSNGMVVCYSDGTTVYVSGGGGSSDPTYLCQGRLTLESGVAISTVEQIDKTNVYFTPYNGNFLDLYDGTKWVRHTFTELTLAVGAFTASKPNDIFIYNNAGTLTLSATEWTNATTRATALTTQDGVPVKTGATGYRYLGTIYIDAGQKCHVTTSKCFIKNYYNRVNKKLIAIETTNSWIYTTQTWRAANGATVTGTSRIEFLSLGTELLKANVGCIVTNSESTSWRGVAVGIGLDSTNTNSADLLGAAVSNRGATLAQAIYNAIVPAGYHYLQWLEISEAVNTTTWYGDGGIPFWQSGLIAEIEY